MNILHKFCPLCTVLSEKPRQLRCALTNCSLPSLLTTVPLQLVFRHHHVNILISFFSLQAKKEKEIEKKMGQRKDPTPSVHSLSSGLSMCFLCKIYLKLLKIKSFKIIKTLLLQICLQKWHPSTDTIYSHYPLKSIFMLQLLWNVSQAPYEFQSKIESVFLF